MIAPARSPEIPIASRQLRAVVIANSVLDRRALSDILKNDAEAEMVGTAPTISLGRQKIAQLNPDIVLLDATIMDAETNVFEAVRKIHASWPELPILMVCESADREPGVRAVKLGATDYVSKPHAFASPDERARFPAALVAKVRAVTAPRAAPAARPISLRPPASLAPPKLAVSTSSAPVNAIAIGASTGGPNALTQLFGSIPKDMPVPILVVQHMPPTFTKMLAQALRSSTGYDVVEAAHGDPVIAGRAYIAPGDFHMTVIRDGSTAGAYRIALNQGAPEGSCRPAIDVLFRSVARAYGAGALGVVLTGMGYDGTRGAKQIVDAGGTVIVQDAGSAVVSTMPTSVAASVTVDGIYRLDAIGPELAIRARRPFERHSFGIASGGGGVT